ncbi:hypothetical protein V1478_014173 [Vespula squamosa]|uniref:Uncharacterized protein n=1 Tax=Vespula squamosa TaxID=30214 RepID=A0ABD2A7Z8_VESSQ
MRKLKESSGRYSSNCRIDLSKWHQSTGASEAAGRASKQASKQASSKQAGRQAGRQASKQASKQAGRPAGNHPTSHTPDTIKPVAATFMGPTLCTNVHARLHESTTN